MQNDFKVYIEWCKKYNLAPSHADNISAYVRSKDMGTWFDEILPLLDEDDHTLNPNLKRALLNA